MKGGFISDAEGIAVLILGEAWLAAILIGLDKVFSIDLLNLLNISYDLILQKGA